MASISFLFRSKKDQGFITLRFKHSENSKVYEFSCNTKEFTTAEMFNNNIKKIANPKNIKKGEKAIFKSVTPRDDQKQKTHKKIIDNLTNLEFHVFQILANTNVDALSKDWLQKTIDDFYNPIQETNISTYLIPFIDYFLKVKSNDFKESRKKHFRVLKNKLERFNSDIQIKDVNDGLKKDFIDYCKKQSYSDQTISSDLKKIKQICVYAIQCGIKTHLQLSNFSKYKIAQEDFIYLSIDELDQIKSFDLSSNERLDNVRDWLLVSCFTGQRISDFMRFTSNNIIFKTGRKLLEFQQQKTGKKMIIPLLVEVEEILNKRNGEFPKAISHQKYNDYVKEACAIIGINEMIESKALEPMYKTGKLTRNDYRKVNLTLEKWNFISSHIGRRSFASNFYSKIPTSVLISITGHSTERQLKSYLQKEDTDIALDAFKYFDKL